MTSDLWCDEQCDFDDADQESCGYHTPTGSLTQSSCTTPLFGTQTDLPDEMDIPPPKMPVALTVAPKKRILRPTDYHQTPVTFWNVSPTLDPCRQCDGYACLSTCPCGQADLCFECATGTYVERTLFGLKCYECSGNHTVQFAQLLDEPTVLTTEDRDASQDYVRKAIFDFMCRMRRPLLRPLTTRIRHMHKQINDA
jgi:hypothetical protein